MTSTMRKAKLEEEYSKYERVVIRVQFQDKLVLQGLFRPRETGNTHATISLVVFVHSLYIPLNNVLGRRDAVGSASDS